MGGVFFGPYRRGQGLSPSAGPYIGDEIDAAKQKGGIAAGAAAMVRCSKRIIFRINSRRLCGCGSKYSSTHPIPHKLDDDPLRSVNTQRTERNRRVSNRHVFARRIFYPHQFQSVNVGRKLPQLRF